MAAVRIGQGFDAHRLVAGRPLRLGGVEIPHSSAGLEGHSDGDVLLHAVASALLGALGDGRSRPALPVVAIRRWRASRAASSLARGRGARARGGLRGRQPRRHRHRAGAAPRAVPRRDAGVAWRRCSESTPTRVNVKVDQHRRPRRDRPRRGHRRAGRRAARARGSRRARDAARALQHAHAAARSASSRSSPGTRASTAAARRSTRRSTSGTCARYLFADLLKRALLRRGPARHPRHQHHRRRPPDRRRRRGRGQDRDGRAPQRPHGAEEIAAHYTEQWLRDGAARRLPRRPSIYCKATEHIPEQIELAQQLEAKGYTYRIDDGLYFDTSKFPALRASSRGSTSRGRRPARASATSRASATPPTSRSGSSPRRA